MLGIFFSAQVIRSEPPDGELDRLLRTLDEVHDTDSADRGRTRPQLPWEADIVSGNIQCIVVGQAEIKQRGAISVANSSGDLRILYAEVVIYPSKVVYWKPGIAPWKPDQAITAFVQEEKLDSLGHANQVNRGDEKLYLLKIPNTDNLGEYHIAYCLSVNQLEGIFRAMGLLWRPQ